MRPNQVTIEQCMSGWADKEKVFFPADKHHAARLTVEDWRAQSLTYGYGRPAPRRHVTPRPLGSYGVFIHLYDRRSTSVWRQYAERCPPVMGLVFLERFPDPPTWYHRRYGQRLRRDRPCVRLLS